MEQQQQMYECIIGRLYTDLLTARNIIDNYEKRVVELEQQISSKAPPQKKTVTEIPLKGREVDKTHLKGNNKSVVKPDKDGHEISH